ncbi:MAG: polyphosphate kinase 2 family protein [Thermoplasmata archaeon]|nr:polyphosphate kinase 2 family protein [Thermoplasmata archaeon]
MGRGIDRFRIPPGARLRPQAWDGDDTSGFRGGKSAAVRELEKLRSRLESLQELLYAEHRHRLLVVLQAMDSAGKDGTIRRVFQGVNPQGVRVASFKVPSVEELAHDFLWRVHREVPATGEITIFNRSHYEDVLVARVHHLVPKPVWERRYREINDFERSLSEEGTSILKFYLHIDKDEQKRRLEERLEDPTKHWKFSLSDPRERRYWGAYMRAYAEALGRTSTDWAPWYFVPSNRKWFRDLVVCRVIVHALEAMHSKYPPLPRALRSLRIT